MYGNELEISVLLGKTLASIEGQVGGDELVFTTTEGERFRMWHEQDCCEGVDIEDISGDLQDLIGSPIVVAEESISGEQPEGVPVREYRDESETWTFYRIATERGYVVIRWYGSSNGYYSERVSFGKVEG